MKKNINTSLVDSWVNVIHSNRQFEALHAEEIPGLLKSGDGSLKK